MRCPKVSVPVSLVRFGAIGHQVVTTEARVAKGECRRFDALDVLREELGIECLVGLPAEIRAAEPRKQKNDRRDQGKCPEGQCGLLHFRFVMNARLIGGLLHSDLLRSAGNDYGGGEESKRSNQYFQTPPPDGFTGSCRENRQSLEIAGSP